MTGGPLDVDGSPAGPDGAAAQLAALRADREALADRLEQAPWWYGWGLGLAVFVLLGSYASHAWWLIGAAYVVFLGGLWALVAVFRRRTGLWINAAQRGPQRPLQWWLACCVGWVALAMVESVLDVRGVLLPAAVAMGLGAVLVGRWWSREYTAQLRAEL